MQKNVEENIGNYYKKEKNSHLQKKFAAIKLFIIDFVKSIAHSVFN
jgi:hypothetical protein